MAIPVARFRAKVRREIHVVDQVLEHRPPIAPPACVAFDATRVLWRIVVPGQPDRYMQILRAETQRFHLVMVDGERLYRAWLPTARAVDDGDRFTNCLLRREMAFDYKFEKAASKFDRSHLFPIPPAIGEACRRRDGATFVNFSDGVTRTFWLLANHAVSFPVLTETAADAEELDRTAGVGVGFIAVRDLATAWPASPAR